MTVGPIPAWEMKSNATLQQKLNARLGEHPLLGDVPITAEYHGREVLVKGVVDQYSKKILVVRIVAEVARTRSIIDHVQVVLGKPGHASDHDIYNAIIERFKRNFCNAHDNVTVLVNQGAVLLEGILKWKYQKLLASDCIIDIEGIVSIENSITTSTAVLPVVREKDILAAIYKEDAVTTAIVVSLNGRRVTLEGTVSDASQQQLIEQIVSAIPGVLQVDSHLVVSEQ